MLERAQVLHVARLARLQLSEAEVERMGAELSKVLDHIEKIRELDLEGVPPTSHVVDVTGVLRADEPGPCLPVDVVVEQAPEPVEVPIPGTDEIGRGFGVPTPGPAEA
jgi:aspartyl-tRNA(Asn)/glutamyl-tRNA(Gln) amidotransferase subunit C